MIKARGYEKSSPYHKVHESIDLPIEIGDTVRMGIFKNKKVVLKRKLWFVFQKKNQILYNDFND